MTSRNRTYRASRPVFVYTSLGNAQRHEQRIVIRCRDIVNLRAENAGAARKGPIRRAPEKARPPIRLEADRTEPKPQRERVHTALARLAPRIEVSCKRDRSSMRRQRLAQRIELSVVG